ncbi:chemotaxis protein CheW [Thioalkalivibrio sp. ALJT]|uniref:chemotaxis protein CheW n=1 Tax=Thioalkalivibrio sp. ALJT TaxID=1158146 RepID=UPI000368D438|nr:chemotaxis protein CheW [Thioalkalivibrio sp. ALJT]
MNIDLSSPYALLASLDREGRCGNRELRRELGSGWRGVLLRVGDFRFLVDMDSIAEVADPMALTRVPLAESTVLGVGNLRGQVLPVFDMGQLLLGRPLAKAASGQRIVVAAQGQGVAGLLVSQVEGMRRCNPSQRRLDVSVPETVQPLIKGGFDLGHRLHPVLDLDLLLNDVNRLAGTGLAGATNREQAAAAGG